MSRLGTIPNRHQIVQSSPVHPDIDGSRRHVLEPVVGDDLQKDEHWSGPFSFIQAADTQFGMIDKYLKKVEPAEWKEEMRLSELLVAKCNQMNPRPLFMVICGDIVDAMPASGADETRREQVQDFKRIFSQLDPAIPLVCVCGNHDIGNEPTLETLMAYREEFGDDYFYFIKRGVLFIVINSQFYKHRANLEEYAEGQDIWLQSMLAKCKQFKYSIVFEHIPWFLEEPDEEDDYFNVERSIRQKWLDKFKEAGVSKIMCGHYHRNAGGWHGDMELIVTSAVGAQLGADKSGVRLVRLLDDTIEHRYHALEDIPEQAGL